MRAALLLIGLASVAQAQPANFSYYASPVLAYQCSGYSASGCVGFETSDAAHTVQSVGIKVTSTNPLQFQVSIWVDNTPYKGYHIPASGTDQPFVVTDTIGSFTTIMVSMTWVKTRHCTKPNHCADRYLPEAGTISM